MDFNGIVTMGYSDDEFSDLLKAAPTYTGKHMGSGGKMIYEYSHGITGRKHEVHLHDKHGPLVNGETAAEHKAMIELHDIRAQNMRDRIRTEEDPKKQEDMKKYLKQQLRGLSDHKEAHDVLLAHSVEGALDKGKEAKKELTAVAKSILCGILTESVAELIRQAA